MTRRPVQKFRRNPPQFLEEAEQEMLVRWAILQFPAWEIPRECLFAIPNGAHLAGSPQKRAFQMVRLKRVGLQTGVADLCLAVPRRGYHGLWVEMKKRREHFRGPAEADRAWSVEQRAFARAVRSQGYQYALAYGFDEGKASIEEYLGVIAR